MRILERLNQKTYAVQHNPNCPSPFLVRLVGPGSSRLDLKCYRETKDILGFGKTMANAARVALKKQEILKGVF